jgi:hypothetical protein
LKICGCEKWLCLVEYSLIKDFLKQLDLQIKTGFVYKLSDFNSFVRLLSYSKL